VLDTVFGAFAFYFCGYAFAFGEGGQTNLFIGLNNFFLMGNVREAWFIFQFAFAATAITIVSGGIAGAFLMKSVPLMQPDIVRRTRSACCLLHIQLYYGSVHLSGCGPLGMAY
jgi:hypothetical protein